jgi:hypothetical protein
MVGSLGFSIPKVFDIAVFLIFNVIPVIFGFSLICRFLIYKFRKSMTSVHARNLSAAAVPVLLIFFFYFFVTAINFVTYLQYNKTGHIYLSGFLSTFLIVAVASLVLFLILYVLNEAFSFAFRKPFPFNALVVLSFIGFFTFLYPKPSYFFRADATSVAIQCNCVGIRTQDIFNYYSSPLCMGVPLQCSTDQVNHYYDPTPTCPALGCVRIMNDL